MAGSETRALHDIVCNSVYQFYKVFPNAAIPFAILLDYARKNTRDIVAARMSHKYGHVRSICFYLSLCVVNLVAVSCTFFTEPDKLYFSL